MTERVAPELQQRDVLKGRRSNPHARFIDTELGCSPSSRTRAWVPGSLVRCHLCDRQERRARAGGGSHEEERRQLGAQLRGACRPRVRETTPLVPRPHGAAARWELCSRAGLPGATHGPGGPAAGLRAASCSPRAVASTPSCPSRALVQLGDRRLCVAGCAPLPAAASAGGLVVTRAACFT